MPFPRAITSAIAKLRAYARPAIAAGALLVLATARLTPLLSASDPSPIAPLALAAARIPTQPPRQPAPLPRPTKPVTFQDGCMTARCHSTYLQLPSVHAPLANESCQSCHAPDAGNHTYPLLSSKSTLCATCHDTTQHRSFQHKALGQSPSDDACTACHDPHASSSANLLLGSSLQDTCARCHPPAEGSSTHTPYATGRCDLCHDPHGAENPSLLLAGENELACIPCHASVAKRIHAGPHSGTTRPVGPHAISTPSADLLTKRSCLACHPPHAASHDRLLTDQPRTLCTSCHADIGNIASHSAVTHDAVLTKDQCVSCHDPHGSGREHSLKDSQPKLCLSCHDKQVKAHDGRQIPPMQASLASAPFIHGAVKLGDCSACHSVHGGSSPHLMAQQDPATKPYAGDARNYTLCYACHDANLARPGDATQFRDGDRNLHELHLRPSDKALGCSSCHAVHSGDLPRLIARTVNFQGSGWAMPMGFELTQNGGRCSSSCHEPLNYSRAPAAPRTPKNEGAP